MARPRTKDRKMKRLIQISVATAILATAGFAQSTDTWFEHWHKAKFGRYSAATETRLKVEQAKTAFRQEATGENGRRSAAPQAPSWAEQWHKAKYGRYSPAYEAKQRYEQTETAFREEPRSRAIATTAPSGSRTTNTWREQWFKAKYGRYSPMEEARQRAEGR